MSEPLQASRTPAVRIPFLELDGNERPAVPTTRNEARALTTLIPGHYAAIYRAIPLHYDGQKLTVALVNPQDSLALSRLQEGAGCPVQAAPLDAAAFSRYYAALYQPKPVSEAGTTPYRNWWWVGVMATVAVWILLVADVITVSVALPLMSITGVFALLSWFLQESD
ncbi:MAG: hypothetical protein H7338_22070 [Candidatus Sericytochromatia bacterium]|nr:hypothetical protein [Candidatus Sericytochromatia bacterium]